MFFFRAMTGLPFSITHTRACLCVCVSSQVKYSNNPVSMAKVIATCLREERRILSSACMQEQVCLHARDFPTVLSEHPLPVNRGRYQEESKQHTHIHTHTGTRSKQTHFPSFH